MARGLFSFGGCLLAAGLAILAGWQQLGRVDVAGIFARLPEVNANLQRGFRSEMIGLANGVRVRSGVGEVGGDEAIQAYLGELISGHQTPENLELDEVFDGLQSRFPGAQYLAANLVTSRTREDLLARLAAWSAVANPEFDAVNTTVFRAGRRLGVLAVMSRRIPEFTLNAANAKGGRFHNRCPHCKTIHALELDKDSRTLILSCPHCDLPFDVLAVDTEGKVRRAPDFIEGFVLPGGLPAKASSPEAHIVELWRRVGNHCEYELDQDRVGPNGESNREVWKASGETWAEASGDCEDTSILLADVLIGAGYDARVAIGWNGNIGQHAWVAVRVGEKQYLLETTLQKEIGREDLVEVGAVSAFYQPEQLFDARGIYYTTARPERFTTDYFSDSLWKPVPQIEEFSQR